MPLCILENVRDLCLPILVLLLPIPVMLVASGVLLFRREGRSLSGQWSLISGIGMGACELASVSGIAAAADGILPVCAGAFCVVLLASFAYLSLVLLAFAGYARAARRKSVTPAPDHVIIHGAVLTGGDRVGTLLAGRIDRAIEIYEACPVKPILMPSGGQGEDETISEAEAMRRYLLEKGIPQEAILIEDRSTSTRENLIFCRELMEERGGSRHTALVTSDYHVYRCCCLASELGMKAAGVGAPVSLCYLHGALIRELAALCTLRSPGRLLILGYLILVILPAAGMMVK